MWDTIVGPDIAAHAQPTLLRDKVLHVQAESTAWATQLRYIQSQVLAKIAAGVGHRVVTSLRITGPKAPSWKKGPRSVPAAAPRHLRLSNPAAGCDDNVISRGHLARFRGSVAGRPRTSTVGMGL